MADIVKILNAHLQVINEVEEECRRSTGSKIYVDRPQELIYPRGHHVPSPPPLPEPAITRERAEHVVKTQAYRQ